MASISSACVRQILIGLSFKIFIKYIINDYSKNRFKCFRILIWIYLVQVRTRLPHALEILVDKLPLSLVLWHPNQFNLLRRLIMCQARYHQFNPVQLDNVLELKRLSSGQPHSHIVSPITKLLKALKLVLNVLMSLKYYHHPAHKIIIQNLLTLHIKQKQAKSVRVKLQILPRQVNMM